MEQTAAPLGSMIGYRLKEAQSALRSRMDTVLREHGLTTPQYICLEVLSRMPGASNSDLARGAFVTRQTMNTLLHTLHDRGLVARATEATSGRSLPTELTPAGQELLTRAAEAVRGVEHQLVSNLNQDQREHLQDYLQACIAALRN